MYCSGCSIFGIFGCKILSRYVGKLFSESATTSILAYFLSRYPKFDFIQCFYYYLELDFSSKLLKYIKCVKHAYFYVAAQNTFSKQINCDKKSLANGVIAFRDTWYFFRLCLTPIPFVFCVFPICNTRHRIPEYKNILFLFWCYTSFTLLLLYQKKMHKIQFLQKTYIHWKKETMYYECFAFAMRFFSIKENQWNE